MTIDYTIRPDGILVLERSGTISTSDEDVNLQKRLKDVKVVPGMRVLVDSQGVVHGDSVDVVRHLAAIARATAAQLECGALALVVRSDVEYGMARMYMALTDDHHPNQAVFRSVDEALSWLKSHPEGRRDPGSAPSIA
jgi:hypothetical protein